MSSDLSIMHILPNFYHHETAIFFFLSGQTIILQKMDLEINLHLEVHLKNLLRIKFCSFGQGNNIKYDITSFFVYCTVLFSFIKCLTCICYEIAYVKYKQTKSVSLWIWIKWTRSGLWCWRWAGVSWPYLRKGFNIRWGICYLSIMFIHLILKHVEISLTNSLTVIGYI